MTSEDGRRGRPRRALRRITADVAERVDPLGFGRALLAETAGLARHPGSTLSAWGRFLVGTASVARATVGRILGSAAAGPLSPPAKDRRFSDRAWEENPVFFALLQGHLLRERLFLDLVDSAGLDERTAKKARLASQFVVDVLAPTNYLFSNPAAVRRAKETRGRSVVRGLGRLLTDLRRRGGWPSIVDTSSFTVGKNMAATPGKVVYRNELMELIQYAPQTETTFERPLLCSPPCINKYYIMDLVPGRSFIEWAVKHGHTTFAISYRNPDASLRDVSLADYLLRGPLEAVRVVRSITGARDVNVAALCMGGTLATMLVAYLNELGDNAVHSLTLMNTLVDFSEPGALGAFTDRETIAGISRRVNKRGFLQIEQMARTFNVLRSNDLIFNYASNGWLMGESPAAFDLLAWNEDGTRIAARMFQEYLALCYQENQLARDAMMIDGRRLRPSAIEQDTFVLGAVEDHITPWRSSFKTTKLFAGKVRFVLTGSGHIAGIVNPPSKNAAYWTNERVSDSPDTWLGGAQRHQETWWEEWSRWVDARAGSRRTPPPLGNDEFRAQADAPGTYVLEH